MGVLTRNRFLMADIGTEDGACRNDIFTGRECLEKRFPELKTVAVSTKKMKTWQHCRDKCNSLVQCHYFKWRTSKCYILQVKWKSSSKYVSGPKQCISLST